MSDFIYVKLEIATDEFGASGFKLKAPCDGECIGFERRDDGVYAIIAKAKGPQEELRAPDGVTLQ